MIDFRIHKEEGINVTQKVMDKIFADLEDGTWHVKLTQHKGRSMNQNAYFHAVIVPMVYDGLRDAGFDEVRSKKDAKLVIKTLFCKKTIVSKQTGEMIDIMQDTSDLSTTEFNAMIDAVIKWAGEYLGLWIPLPNQQMNINFGK